MNDEDDDTIDLRQVLDLLRRQMRLIILVVCSGLGLAGLYLVYATPLYTATTLVLVDSSQKDILNPQEAYARSGGAETARVESEVEIVRSASVALATVSAARLVNDPEFGLRLGTAAKLRAAVGLDSPTLPTGQELLSKTMVRLQSALNVSRRGLTHLISVEITAEDPDRAATIANILSKTYIDLQVQAKVSAALGSRDILQTQVAASQTTMAQAQDDLSNFIDNNIDRLEQEIGSAEFSSLRTQLLSSNSLREDATDQLATANRALASRDWATLAQNLQDDALQSLANQRNTLQQRLKLTAAGTQQEVDLRQGLAQIEQDLANQSRAALSGFQERITILTQSTDNVRDQIRMAVIGGNISSITLTEIFGLQQEADISQRQYQTLLSRMRALEAQAMVQVADSRIVSPALAPSNASFPNKKLILALAFVLSAGLGTGLAFFYEFISGAVTSVEQLRNLVHADAFVSLPHTGQTSEQYSVADNVISAPLSTFSEAVRRIRAAIDQSTTANNGHGRLIVTASAIPSEGKTSISLALARTYAAAGQDCVLIDADMRRPSLHRHLGVVPTLGVLDYLHDPSSVQIIDSLIFQDPRSDANIIAGRGRPSVPTDQLMQSKYFEGLLTNAREQLEFIIVDTPPILPVVDARYILAHADAVIFCTQCGVTSQRDLREAFAEAKKSVRPGTPIIAVLNIDTMGSAGYKYGGYYGDDYTSN